MESRRYYRRKDDESSPLMEVSSFESRLHIHAAGGGFTREVSEEDLKRDYVQVQPDLSLKDGVVDADWMEDTEAYPCYSNGQLWNGWSMPLFDRAVAEVIVEKSGNVEGGEPMLKWDGDAILLYNYDYEPSDPENPRYLRSEPRTHTIDGEQVQLWDIGGGNWTWNSIAYTDQTLHTLQNKYPEKAWRTEDYDFGGKRKAIGFVQNDEFIHDPTMSSCGRFEQADRYGLKEDDAYLLRKHNLVYDAVITGAIASPSKSKGASPR